MDFSILGLKLCSLPQRSELSIALNCIIIYHKLATGSGTDVEPIVLFSERTWNLFYVPHHVVGIAKAVLNHRVFSNQRCEAARSGLGLTPQILQKINLRGFVVPHASFTPITLARHVQFSWG
jgi:hypothetical protein